MLSCIGVRTLPQRALRSQEFPANGAAPRGWPRKAVHGWGRVDGLRRGRCKYVHVSSVAASMRLTPLRSPSTRPRTGSVRVYPRRSKEKIKSRGGLAGRFIAVCRAEPCSAHEQAQRRDPLLIFFFFSVGGRPPKSVRSRSGWVRGGVSRMDAAAKPPGTDSRRPPRTQPDRPTRGFCFPQPPRHHPRGAAPLAGNS